MNGSLDRDRLAAVLGMLGSDHDGVILAAARQAERMRREAGCMWAEIIAPQQHQLPTRGIEEQLRLCLEWLDFLNAWERGFVLSLRRQSRLSEKQAAKLATITDKVDALVRGGEP
jgi:hypothetical protein